MDYEMRGQAFSAFHQIQPHKFYKAADPKNWPKVCRLQEYYEEFPMKFFSPGQISLLNIFFEVPLNSPLNKDRKTEKTDE